MQSSKTTGSWPEVIKPCMCVWVYVCVCVSVCVFVSVQTCDLLFLRQSDFRQMDKDRNENTKEEWLTRIKKRHKLEQIQSDQNKRQKT